MGNEVGRKGGYEMRLRKKVGRSWRAQLEGFERWKDAVLIRLLVECEEEGKRGALNYFQISGLEN